jgi:hypothetical protein
VQIGRGILHRHGRARSSDNSAGHSVNVTRPITVVEDGVMRREVLRHPDPLRVYSETLLVSDVIAVE